MSERKLKGKDLGGNFADFEEETVEDRLTRLEKIVKEDDVKREEVKALLYYFKSIALDMIDISSIKVDMAERNIEKKNPLFLPSVMIGFKKRLMTLETGSHANPSLSVQLKDLHDDTAKALKQMKSVQEDHNKYVTLP